MGNGAVTDSDGTGDLLVVYHQILTVRFAFQAIQPERQRPPLDFVSF